MPITKNHLLAIVPGLGARADVILNALNNAMEKYGIDTPKRIAFFLGQVLVESGDFYATRENMNYSAQRLMMVWPKRFPTVASATPYAHEPEKLANFVYANRMGNGDPLSGDGWRHRGAGWIQLTGKNNQLECAEVMGIAPDDIGDWLATPEGAALSAAWFWWKVGCNRLADFGNLDAVSDAVNLGRQTKEVGDAHGYTKRLNATNTCKKVLGV